MGPKHLRIALSVLFFAAILVMFLWEGASFGILTTSVLSFQFIPSIIHFFGKPAGILGAGFLAILLITLLFGRVYCASLCPLGVLQDILIWLLRKTEIGGKPGFLPSYAAIRYSIMLLTAITAGFGSLVLVNLLDPFSLFGRFGAHVFNPATIYANNLAAGILTSHDYHLLYTQKLHFVPPFALLVTLFFISFVLIFTVFFGRAYCNIICPLGALLGFISKYSLYRFRLDKGTCRSCGACESLCKSGCIDLKEKHIDHSRCVACFNCLSGCDKGAITYSLSTWRLEPMRPHLSKRKFLINSAAFGATLLGFFSLARLSFSSSREAGSSRVSPPGSISISRFTQTCTACHLCVSACKTHVLVPTLFGYGPSGFLQPVLDFQLGHCDFNCNICGSICPSGAILPLTLKEKQRVQLGKAVLNEKLCVVYKKKQHCGACGEACPTFAISPMDKAHHFAPVVDNQYCIGCGACEKACPTHPKAIFVTGTRRHGRAEIRPVTGPAGKIDKGKKDDGFPF